MIRQLITADEAKQQLEESASGRVPYKWQIAKLTAYFFMQNILLSTERSFFMYVLA